MQLRTFGENGSVLEQKRRGLCKKYFSYRSYKNKRNVRKIDKISKYKLKRCGADYVAEDLEEAAGRHIIKRCVGILKS